MLCSGPQELNIFIVGDAIGVPHIFHHPAQKATYIEGFQ